MNDEKLSFTPTRQYPFDFLLEKTQDEFGEEQIEGHVKTYKLVDGKLTEDCETINIMVYK